MSNSYRIRTQVGVDKSVNVQLEQDFETLEILSLRITQSQIYTRQCADYGVIVGRITANDGFGIPNARISVFIPLSDEDENNPIISDLYPYRSLTTTNDNGFRYNLLPKTQSHSGHAPTGSFFDKEEILLNPNYIEVFDKYFKYTSVTNDSGDYMIFGLPIGSQTIHVDVDLSDIGEFSLSPQDLIRMGIATEAQVAGTRFRTSTNLNELPQIVSFNRTLEVVPLWGQPEVCNLGITRTDFDLATEANVTITPTSIFMGSLFSTNDKDFQRRNCKPKTKQGELCNLVAGPGEILAIRQTIFEDEKGRPILETYDLESGGQVIDENGVWLVDVPMNLDYVITNEFGERVLSNDPKKGIPTKGKYRFKIKWNQSPKLSETVKRGYFLVPNVREYGWTSNSIDPTTIDDINDSNYQAFIKSYAFSVDWNDYGLTATTLGQKMIQEAIDCEDKFYPMVFNKVYSVSQLIDQYRNGYLPNRTIAIKNILDDTCESENVRFPTNDTVYRFDILYLLFLILLFIARPILNIGLIVAHLVAFILKELLGNRNWRRIAFMEVPNLTFPDCDLCECQEGQQSVGPGPTTAESAFDVNLGLAAYISPLTQFSYWTGPITDGGSLFGIQQLLSGNNTLGTNYGSPQLETVFTDGRFNSTGKGFTNSLPLWERINLFNVKAKYFNQLNRYVNPGGGYNRIKVNFAPTENGYYGENFYNEYNLERLGIKVIGNTTFTNPNPNVYSILNPLPFQQQISQPLLVSNPWDSITNTYTVAEDGEYTVTLGVGPSPYTSGQKNFYVVINGVVQASPLINLFPAGSVSPTYSATLTRNFNVGDTIKIELQQKGLPDIMSYNYELEISGRPFGYGDSNTRYHLDNTMLLMVKPDKINELRPGTILSFQNPDFSADPNVTGYTIGNQFGTTSTTGTTKNTQSGVLVQYANPDGSGNWVGPGGFSTSGNSFYQITQNNNIQTHRFAIDIEYFQVITAMTVNEYISMSANNRSNDDFNNRIIQGNSLIHVVNQSDRCYNTNFCGWPRNTRTIQNFQDYGEQVIVFMVRGVDPYSDRIEIEYDLSRLFGYPLDQFGRPNGPIVVRGTNYKMNIPIQGRYKSVKHFANTSSGIDPNTNQFLYHPSYRFKDSTIGDAKYTGFTSNLPAYYSSLDETTPTNFFTGANLLRDTLDDGYANVFGGSPYLKVRGTYQKYSSRTFSVDNIRELRNVFQVVLRTPRSVCVGGKWFIAENNQIASSVSGLNPGSGFYVESIASSTCNPGNPNVNQNFYTTTGYFPDEIVDGGSYMSGEMDKERSGGRDLRFISWYYSPTYDNSQTMGFQFNAIDDRIVMRGDRLPTSTNTFRNGANSYAWQANISLSLFIITEDGTFFNATGSPVGTPSFSDFNQNIQENNLSVLNTFDCQSLVPLSCYYVPNGATEINVRPEGDNCYTNNVRNDRQLVMRGGCYVFITSPFNSLDKDLSLLWEWTSRIQINFAACRNVFSHVFTNNWVNGSLFAFSFQNSRFFNNNNEPISDYCKDVLILEPSDNNFYYRSSPYFYVNVFPPAPQPSIPVGVFRGSRRPSSPSILGINFPSFGGNERNLKFPTTMIDLGPRSQYLQELVFTNDFDGYMVNRLRDTSYQDVSEILNSFVINRITNKRVLDSFINRRSVNVNLFFQSGRDNLFVDGDYAQMISINSELGVFEFNSINYPLNPTGQDALFFNNPNARDSIFGIFFSSDTQTRDFVSPRRTILNPNLPIIGNNNCSFDNIGTFSQEVPFYQWEINENAEVIGESIFGSESNDWYTFWLTQYENDDSNLDYQSFFKYRYQSLDRLFKYSRYYRPSGNGNPLNGDFKGYIYSIDRTQPPPELETRYRVQNPPNDTEPRVFQTGAPFFFYFGLKKGKTAWDRFAKKWIDFNNIVE